MKINMPPYVWTQILFLICEAQHVEYLREMREESEGLSS
jgi:hypothetical protein